MSDEQVLPAGRVAVADSGRESAAAATATPPGAGGWRLHRNALQQLVLVAPDGSAEAGVVPVRHFPLSAPEAGISLVGADGRERLHLPMLDRLDEESRRCLEEELHAREFAPCILRIIRVSSVAMPSTWQVETDRGQSQFVLKAEEDIRRLADSSLRIVSAHGMAWRIPDPKRMDRASRRMLERFL